ncbi:hypothetical protein [Sphingomonas sp.]|uniref:hypothetical protein n=1 Tax=Sphingomonas sp. TaxID=28214 RepID=UPI0038AA6D03
MPSDTPNGQDQPSAPAPLAPEIRPDAARGNEGGDMIFNSEQIIHNRLAALPYQAVLTRPRGEPLSHSFATMREAEAFVRSNTPTRGRALSALYDRPASYP